MSVAQWWNNAAETVNSWVTTEHSIDLLTIGWLASALLLGTALGAGFVLKHARSTLTNAVKVQNKRDIAAQNKAIDGYLQALQVESKVVFDIYKTKLSGELEALAEGEALLKGFPHARDCCCVYFNNTHFLGKITNDALRLQIVKAHTLFNHFAAVLDHHNRLVTAFSELDLLAQQSQKPIDQHRAQRQLNLIKEHCKVLKLDYAVMSAQMHQMIVMLSSHRQQK